MAPISTIELPRLEGESARAYQARCEYITAGPQRDLRTLAQKLDKSLTIVGRWSSQYNWVEHAARYDETVYTLAAQEAADQYRADLADYRKRYGNMGKALYGSAAKLLNKVNKTLDDPDVELGIGALITALSAIKTAADLEALALRIEPLLGQLDNAESPDK